MTSVKAPTKRLTKRTAKRAMNDDSRMWRNISDIVGGGSTSSGISVTPSTALSFSAVYAAVRVISETIASLPLLTYRRLERGKERATTNPAYYVLHDTPNDYMTSMVFRETAMVHILLWGNAYAEISWGGNGGVKQLNLVEPWRCKPCIKDGRLQYKVTTSYDETGNTIYERTIDYRDIIHVPGLGFNGVQGRSVISWARESIGLGLRSEEFGASFFGKAARPSGVLEHPGILGEDAATRLRDSWQRTYGSAENTGKVAVLEEGLKFNPLTIPPEDAQFLETRKFQVEEVARWFRLPPHKIGDLTHSTFSNIEHQSLEFVSDSIRPWLVRWEQEINRKLLGGDVFCEHLIEGLLRGDIQSRYTAYSIGKQNGWLNADEIREMENMNPLPDAQGEMYLVPLNMIPANRVDEMLDAKEDPTNTTTQDPMPGPPSGVRDVLISGLIDAMQRMISIEAANARKHSKDAKAFIKWRADWYGSHVKTRSAAVADWVRAISVIDNRPELVHRLDEFVGVQLRQGQTELARATAGIDGDISATVDQIVSRWEVERAKTLASELIGGE